MTLTNPATIAKRNYLANLRSFERLLPNGIIQQLHVGSDLHTSDDRDAIQVNNWLQHVQSKPLGSCLVLNEAVGLSDKPLCPASPEIYPSLFLHASLKEALKNKITGRSIETRAFSFPEYASHEMTVSKIMSKLKKIQCSMMVHKDKELVRPDELSALDNLNEILQPHMQKTIRELSKKEQLAIQFSDRFFEDNFLVHKKEPFSSLVKVASCLMDNIAVVEVCTAEQPNIYLNMGIWHILLNTSKRSCIDHRIRSAGWTLVHESNPHAAAKYKQYEEDQPVDIATHFKTLPPLGNSLTKSAAPKLAAEPIIQKPKKYKHTSIESLACKHLESMCQGTKETSYHKLDIPGHCIKKTKESCYRCGFSNENSSGIPLSDVPNGVSLN